MGYIIRFLLLLLTMSRFVEILENQIMLVKLSIQIISKVSETAQNTISGYEEPGFEGGVLLKTS